MQSEACAVFTAPTWDCGFEPLSGHEQMSLTALSYDKKKSQDEAIPRPRCPIRCPQT